MWAMPCQKWPLDLTEPLSDDPPRGYGRADFLFPFHPLFL
jgi:hypothetical protein